MPTPKLPRVVYPGGLSPKRHAILNAIRWQRKVAAENTPTPSEPYTVIVDLLAHCCAWRDVSAMSKRAQKEEA